MGRIPGGQSSLGDTHKEDDHPERTHQHRAGGRLSTLQLCPGYQVRGREQTFLPLIAKPVSQLELKITQRAAICPPSFIDTPAPNHAHTHSLSAAALIHACIHLTPSLSFPSSHHLIHNDKDTRDPHVSFHLVGLSVPTTVHGLQSLDTPHGLLFYSPPHSARRPAILEMGLQRTGPGHCGRNTTEGQRGAAGQTRLLQGPPDRGTGEQGTGDTPGRRPVSTAAACRPPIIPPRQLPPHREKSCLGAGGGGGRPWREQ